VGADGSTGRRDPLLVLGAVSTVASWAPSAADAAASGRDGAVIVPVAAGGRTTDTCEGLVIGPSIGGIATLGAVVVDVAEGPTMMIPGLAVGLGSAYGSIGRMFPDGPALGVIVDDGAYGSIGFIEPEGAVTSARGRGGAAGVELGARGAAGLELDAVGCAARGFAAARDASHGATTQRWAA